jgi:hypothetical protein
MVLRPEARSRGGRPLSISTARPTLSISQGNANAMVSLKQGIDGELVCEGNVSGSGFRGARIELVRSSSVGTSKVTERMAEVQGSGEISGTWKPVPSSFEDDFLLVFHPGKLGSGEVYQIKSALKAKPIMGPMGLIREHTENFVVVSDGTGPNYRLRLVLDRHLRDDLFDEVEIPYPRKHSFLFPFRIIHFLP